MVVRLRVSKADLKNQGVLITIGCTKQDICAYCSMLLFHLLSGKRLSFMPNTASIYIQKRSPSYKAIARIRN